MSRVEEDVPRLVVSVAEAAAALGVGENTVHRMIERGELREVRISPRRVGIRYRELVALVEGGK